MRLHGTSPLWITWVALCLASAGGAAAQSGSTESAGAPAPFVHNAAPAPSGRNNLRLRRNGDRIELRRDGASVALASRPFAEASSVVVNGSSGDDTLIVDFSGGNPVPPGGLDFDGGAQVTAQGDTLMVVGGPFQNVTFVYLNAHDGSIDLDGVQLRYRGLEPIVLGGSVADLVLVLPNGGSDAVLEDDGTPANGMSRLRSTNSTFETTVFANPTNSLTITGGTGADTITVLPDFDNGPGAGQFNAGLIIDGAGGSDGISQQAVLALTGNVTLTAESISISAGVTTSGYQTYAGPVTLGASITLASTASGDIAFNATLDGGLALIVNTGGGSNFFGVVGGITPLLSVQTDAPGLTRVAANVTTSGGQTWSDQLALFGNVTLASNASGTISFAQVDNNFALRVNTGGPTVFNSPVGSLVKLASLTTDAGGSTAINGGSVQTNLLQSYGDPVSLGAPATLTSNTSGAISLLDTVNGAFGLTVNTAGTTTFGGAVGGTTPLASLTTDAAGSTSVNGGAVATSGGQTYSDPVSLGTTATFTAAGAISMPNTATGNVGAGLTKAGTGTMTLSAANTYSGATLVSAGTLRVNNGSGSGTGSGAVTVASGATLGGVGTISGPVTVQLGGIFAPGNSTGTLNAGGGLTWNGSAGAPTALFELSNVNSTSDVLAVTGALTKGSGPTFGFDFQGTGHTATYTVATFTSTNFTVGQLTFTNLAPGLTGSFILSGGNTLQFSAIASAAVSFQVTAPASVSAGSAFPFNVTAHDGIGGVDTSYSGTVNFTSTDPAAVLPAGSTLVNGVGTFSATLNTPGLRTITATDSVSPSITGTSGPIRVDLAAAIPMLSPLAFLVLASLLAAFAIRRLRN